MKRTWYSPVLKDRSALFGELAVEIILNGAKKTVDMLERTGELDNPEIGQQSPGCDTGGEEKRFPLDAEQRRPPGCEPKCQANHAQTDDQWHDKTSDQRQGAPEMKPKYNHHNSFAFIMAYSICPIN